MSAPDAVRLPVPTSRSGRRWLVATAVAVLVVMAVIAVTQPENRPAVLVTVPVLALLTAGLLWRSTWLEPAGGALVVLRLGRFRRRVPLGPTTSVALVPNGAGGLLLGARPQGSRRRLFVSVLSLTDYVEASLPPELLRSLADTLERHRAGGAPAVARALRAQAEHLEAGGDLRGSPLAPLLTYGAVNAAKAGGAGAVGSQLGG
ncbi:hypothetical protein [Cellulomonas hominis]|uniref:hypothetical protein n=1 Tax=Cellulomonas hominis TaxID=156981 RepID=UPI001B95B614|nr:hypothetical protein [Cellulomonas hominis]VTR77564.1 hypothetical protein CHMI_02334 [Cellulomonas hominis]